MPSIPGVEWIHDPDRRFVGLDPVTADRYLIVFDLSHYPQLEEHQESLWLSRQAASDVA